MRTFFFLLVTWILRGFKEVLVIGVYILSLIPISYCAPARRDMSEEDRMNSHPKWINPCGIGAAETQHPAEDEGLVISDGDLLTQIINQAKIALTEADHFKQEYVLNTFGMGFDAHHQLWHGQHYDWLPEIPKHLNAETSEEHLNNLELDGSLLDAFEYLQKIAVGLEQVVWDQEDENGQYHGKFKDTEFKLRALLCEIQVAIIERGLTMREDVRRDIMNEAYRQMENSSHRNVRDWLIFRDYMNTLQYVIDVFENFKSKL